MTPLSLPLPFETPAPADARRSVIHSVEVPPAESPALRVRSRRRTVWLALHLRDWPLYAALAGLDEPTRSALTVQPLAVVDDDRRSTVLACNELAARFGVRPGHSLNAVIALCADTKFLPRDATGELELLQSASQSCETYTSFVSLQPPNEVLLEVRGSFRLFGGITALMDRVRRDFQSRGLTVGMAVSATPQSAVWIARASTGPKVVTPRELIPCITRLPVSVLHWPVEVELRLARFGVLCIGDLLRLPRGSLARRIGHRRLADLDHAVGRHPEVRQAHRACESYEDCLLLDFEIETTGLLSAVIEKRLQRLTRFLIARNLAVDRVQLDLRHRDALVTPVTIGLARPTSDVAHVIKLMHERLSHVQLCAPVAEVMIRVDQLRCAPSSSRSLFASVTGIEEAAAAGNDLQARLLEQLRARLGEHAIGCVAPTADYRPECAHTAPPAVIQTKVSDVQVPTTLAPRPLWLLPQPQVIAADQHRARTLQRLRGPEVLESGWWDGCPMKRAYFHVRSPLGALAWVYEDRSQPHRWCLHGLYG